MRQFLLRPAMFGFSNAAKAASPWFLLLLGAAFGLLLMTLPAVAQPPLERPAARAAPEDALPGANESSRKNALPGENELPGGPAENALPGGAAAKLPSENALPGQSSDREELLAALPGEDQLPGDRRPEEPEAPNRPWLRFATPGHTGIVRAVTFTKEGRLCTAGDDKDVKVWARRDAVPGDGSWSYERTIRWQVQRGSRGRIYALASGGGLLALAGHSAMGGLGDITLVDPTTGELKRSLADEENGHRQVVAALAITPDAKHLVSMDVAGTLVHWSVDPKTGSWGARRLLAPDVERYGEATAKALQPWRRLTPLALMGKEGVVVPVLAREFAPDERPTWKLRIFPLRGGEPRDLTADHHFGMVTSMSATADGTRLASADYPGNVTLWRLDGREEAVRLSIDEGSVAKRTVTALSFTGDGTKLVVGTSRTQNGDSARIQVWDVRRTRAPIASIPVRANVYSLAVSNDNQAVAYTQGSDVVLASLARLSGAPKVLRSPLPPVARVAFPLERPFYRIAIDRGRGAGPVFDAHRIRLEEDAPLKKSDWIDRERWKGGWQLDRQRLVLQENGQQRGRIPLIAEIDGNCISVTWIPDRTGKPVAVVIGTDGRNNIYVFDLAREGECRLLRQFRGHQSAVSSVGISHDLKYLVSASRDGTVMCWSLGGYADEPASVNRWGAEFSAEDGKVAISSVREDGPLYARGVRSGDVVTQIEWATDTGEVQVRRTSDEILGALEELNWRSLVVFRTTRGAVEQKGFQVFPAWQPIASLLVAADRQWAFWTPAGYYDASFDGHKLFGWQVNRGRDLPPDFILAAQLRKALEKPDVMRKLLPEGSLEGAFRAARLDMPAGEHRVLAAQTELTPRVRILEPRQGERLSGDTVRIRAEISLAAGEQLVLPKAFANGVFAGRAKLVKEAIDDSQAVRLFEWQARVPSDREIVLQVAASTEAEASALASVQVQHTAGSRRRQRLLLIAAGVSEYRDSQIASLDYAAHNAEVVAQTFAGEFGDLYDVEATTLVNEHVNRFQWHVQLEEAARRLRNAPSPDDLLVVYLSGHGVRDALTQQYWFVPADANYRELANGRYEDCLSLDDLREFADVPCRKLVVLDTCHSGAVQPLGAAHLKPAVRTLQQDLFFTLTASEGTEEAVEAPEHRLGRFTYHLVAALRGAADEAPAGGDGDGVITLKEVIQYVDRQVGDSHPTGLPDQHPTAGPQELLPYAEVPLTMLRQ